MCSDVVVVNELGCHVHQPSSRLVVNRYEKHPTIESSSPRRASMMPASKALGATCSPHNSCTVLRDIVSRVFRRQRVLRRSAGVDLRHICRASMHEAVRNYFIGIFHALRCCQPLSAPHCDLPAIGMLARLCQYSAEDMPLPSDTASRK